MNPESRIIGY